MTAKLALVLTLTLILSSCASKTVSLEDEIQSREYAGHSLTVGTALEMAKSSYVLGCVSAHPEDQRTGKHQQCLESAESHVRENLMSIFDQ